MELWSTGQAAQLLGVKSRDLSYAITRGRAGRVTFCGGRAALTGANVRELAKHFGKPCPPCCREDVDACILELRQAGRPTAEGGKA